MLKQSIKRCEWQTNQKLGVEVPSGRVSTHLDDTNDELLYTPNADFQQRGTNQLTK